MKILVIGTDRNLFSEESPVRSRVIDQSNLVDKMKVVVFSRRKHYFERQSVSDRLELIPTNSISRLTYIFDAIRIGRSTILNDHSGQWVISAQDPFECGLVALVLSKMTGTPLHVQLHTDPFSGFWKHLSLLNHMRALLAGIILRQADSIRVVSDRVLEQLLKLGIDQSLVTKVPVFVDIEKFKESLNETISDGFPGFGKVVLTVGRLEHEKNFSVLIKAFKQVLDVHTDALLLIIGSGTQHKRLVRLSEWLGIDDHVRLIPWSHDVTLYYKRADVYVQPSLYEGWGMSVIEAMSAGTPVIMTDVGCAGEVVINEVTGLVVRPDDVNDLAQAILRMLGDNELRVALSAAAEIKVNELPSRQRTYDLYKESWEKALPVH